MTTQPDPLTIAREAQELERRCLAAGRRVTLGGSVDSETAAEVLGVAAGTLRNWRAAGIGPAYTPIRGRCWYSVTDLAAWRLGYRSTAP